MHVGKKRKLTPKRSRRDDDGAVPMAIPLWVPSAIDESLVVPPCQAGGPPSSKRVPANTLAQQMMSLSLVGKRRMHAEGRRSIHRLDKAVDVGSVRSVSYNDSKKVMPKRSPTDRSFVLVGNTMTHQVFGSGRRGPSYHRSFQNGTTSSGSGSGGEGDNEDSGSGDGATVVASEEEMGASSGSSSSRSRSRSRSGSSRRRKKKKSRKMSIRVEGGAMELEDLPLGQERQHPRFQAFGGDAHRSTFMHTRPGMMMYPPSGIMGGGGMLVDTPPAEEGAIVPFDSKVAMESMIGRSGIVDLAAFAREAAARAEIRRNRPEALSLPAPPGAVMGSGIKEADQQFDEDADLSSEGEAQMYSELPPASVASGRHHQAPGAGRMGRSPMTSIDVDDSDIEITLAQQPSQGGGGFSEGFGSRSPPLVPTAPPYSSAAFARGFSPGFPGTSAVPPSHHHHHHHHSHSHHHSHQGASGGPEGRDGGFSNHPFFASAAGAPVQQQQHDSQSAASAAFFRSRAGG